MISLVRYHSRDLTFACVNIPFVWEHHLCSGPDSGISRDLLCYACRYVTCLYKPTFGSCLSALFGTPPEYRTNLDVVTTGDSVDLTAVQNHDLGCHTGCSACLLGGSPCPVPSKNFDEPYENLQTRVSERSQRDAMLSLAHSECSYLVPVYLKLIISLRSCILPSTIGYWWSTRRVNASLPVCGFYDVNRITGLSSTRGVDDIQWLFFFLTDPSRT